MYTYEYFFLKKGETEKTTTRVHSTTSKKIIIFLKIKKMN